MSLGSICEIAEIDVIAARKTAFEAAVTAAAPHFKAARAAAASRSTARLSIRNAINLTVGWRSVEDPMVHFRENAGF